MPMIKIELRRRIAWRRSEPRRLPQDFAPEAFYQAWFPRVYAYFARRSSDRATAEDLTAETFERILGALSDFRTDGDPVSTRAWVYRIAANVYKNRLRSEDRRKARDSAWAERWRPEAGVDLELSLVLGHAVSQLDPSDRDVLGLRFWEELTAVEISSVLGLEQRQVYTILDRCMRELRRQLEPVMADPGLASEGADE